MAYSRCAGMGIIERAPRTNPTCPFCGAQAPDPEKHAAHVKACEKKLRQGQTSMFGQQQLPGLFDNPIDVPTESWLYAHGRIVLRYFRGGHVAIGARQLSIPDRWEVDYRANGQRAGTWTYPDRAGARRKVDELLAEVRTNPSRYGDGRLRGFQRSFTGQGFTQRGYPAYEYSPAENAALREQYDAHRRELDRARLARLPHGKRRRRRQLALPLEVNPMESNPSAAFDRLAHQVEDEYLARGFSPERAAYIGRATAGEVARERQNPQSLMATVLEAGFAIGALALGVHLWRNLNSLVITPGGTARVDPASFVPGVGVPGVATFDNAGNLVPVGPADPNFL